MQSLSLEGVRLQPHDMQSVQILVVLALWIHLLRYPFQPFEPFGLCKYAKSIDNFLLEMQNVPTKTADDYRILVLTPVCNSWGSGFLWACTRLQILNKIVWIPL